MRGLQDFGFPLFDMMAEQLRRAGYTVFSPAERDRQDGFNEKTDTELSLDYYMSIDLPEVCRAERGVALLNNWAKSHGAKIEAFVAREVGKQIVWADNLKPLGKYDLYNVLGPTLLEGRKAA